MPQKISPELLSILKRARASIQETLRMTGDDHHVGLCNCGEVALLDDIDSYLRGPINNPALQEAGRRAEEQAKHLLTYYLRIIAEHAGMTWQSDMNAEVEDIVHYIVQAAREK